MAEPNLRATANAEENWGVAWERGIEPIRQFAVQSMKEDVWNLDANLAEDSYTFQAAMVLLASAVVGPYIDRLAAFLEYPRGLVQVMAARLYEARIWENDEVHCESSPRYTSHTAAGNALGTALWWLVMAQAVRVTPIRCFTPARLYEDAPR